jgi:hypothetical protein
LRFAYPYFFDPGSTPTSDTLIASHFDAGAESFTYQDDAFRGSREPNYADGSWESWAGHTGGGLLIDIGGINNSDIRDMSGGWERVFTMNEAGNVALSFRYRLTQASDYESDEYSQMLVTVDGVLYGEPPHDYVARITGNGDGGPSISTDWQTFNVEVGSLTAGPHTLVIGGYNYKKTRSNEVTNIRIDDVLAVWEPAI